MKTVLTFFGGCALLVGLAGCGETPAAPTGAIASPSGEKGHSHEGWWCDEHGVPEELCGQCDAKLAAQFQKAGDWCKKHDRPESQCFLCHPEREERFAAQYEAKYGTKPPKPQG